jgi:hypothetical protein
VREPLQPSANAGVTGEAHTQQLDLAIGGEAGGRPLDVTTLQGAVQLGRSPADRRL